MTTIPFAFHIASGRSRRHKPTTAIIEPGASLRVLIDYPLTTPYHLSSTHEDGRGWTGVEFTNAIRVAYLKIYEEESDPGYVDGLLNRAKSEGPHGIWGHYIDDLTLEEATRRENGEWRLFVGS